MVGNKTNRSVSSNLQQASREKALDQRKAKQSLRLLELEATRHGDRLKLGAHEQIPGEQRTIRHYEEIQVSMDMIQSKCHEIVDSLNKANRKGRVGREDLVKLKEIGQVLHDELFSLSVKEKLRKTKAEYLTLKIDDQLVHVPWELLNDGQQFLCQRFAMGRLVKTRQPIPGVGSRILARPLNMLILADPEGDLKGAYAEGTQIRDYTDHYRDLINASLRSGSITPDSVKEKIRNFDFVHFAGHADYHPQNAAESGWRLTGGSLKASDIKKMAGTAAMPALIFSNACQSARTEQWVLNVHFEDEIFGLANAFLLAGVKHYIGTFWEILDEPSSSFALAFYKHLLKGMTIGEAVRRSRQALIREYGEEIIVWASYLLYGDPTSNYMQQIKVTRTQHEPESVQVSAPGAELRAREEVIDFAEKKVPKKSRTWWVVGAGLILFVAVLLWGYPGFLKKGNEQYERAALAYYNEGNFKDALNVCKTLEEKSPVRSLTYLVRGNIYLSNGKLDAAEVAYHKACNARRGTEMQKSHALIGLGRIASVRKRPDDALRFYQQATEAAPESRLGYISQALLLQGRGNYKGALNLFQKAQLLAPQDQVLAAITNETRKKITLATDKEKQERINRIVKELLETMKSSPEALFSDGWTSPPLTLWVRDFKVQGYSLQEGQERLLVSGITDQMLRHSRCQLVERALFDKVVEELKLGTTDLIDRRAALSLGKILAARLMVSGHMVYAGPQVQVSMRLIETETGRIAAAVNESFGSSTPASVLAKRLSKNLLEKLKKLYPLRGKVSEVKDEEIWLNIGQMVGVRIGQQFKVVDKDVTLEVISVQQDTSVAEVKKGKGQLQEGHRVEAIYSLYELNNSVS